MNYHTQNLSLTVELTTVSTKNALHTKTFNKFS